jgi:AcrR family transcriptional regulator
VNQDLETRARLIRTAATLFAERGFTKVTVREICRASRANVAAVNYHFGDKAGLYREVVKTAIQTMRETNELSQRAGEGESPEDQIRAFVRIFVSRLIDTGPSAWIHKLMAREMEDPGEALDLVMKQVIQPRVDYLSKVTGAIMGLAPTDPHVMRAITSLQGQCLLFARSAPGPMAKAWSPIQRDVDGLVEHIAEFSLAGMKAVGALARTR